MIPGKVTLNEKVVQVSAGDSHTAAVTEDGSVYIWGSFRVSELLVRESGPVCCLSNYFYHPSITFYVIVFVQRFQIIFPSALYYYPNPKCCSQTFINAVK